MSDVEVKPYPFDVHALEKGVWISAEVCERLLNIKRHDRRYSLGILGLRRKLQKAWARDRGEIITTRGEKDGIRICDDNSAVPTNTDRFAQGVGKIRRSTRDLAGADRSKMTPEMKAEQERGIVRQSAFLSAGRKASRTALKAVERKTPGLELTSWAKK